MKVLLCIVWWLSGSVALKLSWEEEESLLRGLGLRSKPAHSKKDIVIPTFLLEQYKERTGLREVDTSNFGQPGNHLSYSNTLKSYPARKRRRKSFEIFLDFDFMAPEEEIVLAAQLKVFWKPYSIKPKSEETSRIFRKITPRFPLNIYDDKGNLLDTKTLTHKDPEMDEGWYNFDVLPAVDGWIRNNQTSNKNHTLILERGPLRLSAKSKELKIRAQGNFSEVYLIVYSEDFRHKERRKSRSKRSSSDRKKNRKKHRKKKQRHQECQRHSLYVDFSIVGWNDWIVAPPGYHAYYCQGECPFPMSDHFNSTNHAIVQTLVNSVTPNAVPRACCVPTEMSPISMLYLDEYEKVVLKNYESMVVEGCGCR